MLPMCSVQCVTYVSGRSLQLLQHQSVHLSIFCIGRNLGTISRQLCPLRAFVIPELHAHSSSVFRDLNAQRVAEAVRSDSPTSPSSVACVCLKLCQEIGGKPIFADAGRNTRRSKFSGFNGVGLLGSWCERRGRKLIGLILPNNFLVRLFGA